MPVRILLTDDHPVIIQGIRTILESEEEFEIVAEFRNGQALLQSPQIHDADLLLLDLNMPRVDGLQVLSALKDSGAKVKTIIISAYSSQKLAEECQNAGASAYILKTEQLSDLKEIIRQVMEGEKIFPDFFTSNADAGDKFSYMDDFLIKYKLTKREVEIIRMICNGMTSADIATRLFLSVFTVQTHRKNMLRKLSLDHSNQMSLYEFASKNGLI